MSQFPSAQLSPSPETIRHLTDRVVMPKDQFLQLPDEARMRAFTIARQTQANILQQTLDAINQHVAEGGTLWTFKEKFPQLVAPYRESGREWHLDLVVQQNTRQALAVGAYQQRQRVKEAFPYVEYQTGPNPRPSHESLDGKIFAVDDPFLFSHTPPWEHGCNCDLIPRTASQVGRVQQEDQDAPIEDQRVVPGNPQLETLAIQNKMPDPESGALHPVDVTPANQKADGDDYSFRPDRLNQDIDLTPYSEDLRKKLAEQLRTLGYTISEDGTRATAAAFPGRQAMKSARIAEPRERVVAFKTSGGLSTAASGASCNSRHLGRGSGRLGKPAPQRGRGIARVSSPHDRRAA